MNKRKYRKFMCDFETTVYEGQEFTEVWAAAIVEIGTEDVIIFNSLPDLMKYVLTLKGHIMLYFHNLKFDGIFILNYLMERSKWKPAITEDSNIELQQIEWLKEWQMFNYSYKYMISEMGAFYSIMLKQGGRYIEIRDSLKLLPFSVKEIGKAFNTKHQKLDIEYKGFRYAGCPISPEEKEYIKNDVLVVAEALLQFFNEGHTKISIGSCCLDEYKHLIHHDIFNEYFPNLEEIILPNGEDADTYIRRAYKGGWCYLVPEKANKIIKNGITLDVNSLYPFQMSGRSGALYPIGEPHYWEGEIPGEALNEKNYFFVQFKTRFYLKENFLPTVQIKGNALYRPTEWLTTSDIYFNGSYHKKYIDVDGLTKPAIVTLTMTQTDFETFLKHYHVEDFEILGGVWFKTAFGIFDKYINKYAKIKMESTGAKRTIAKLFLNSLYGKTATSKNSSFKFACLREDGSVGFLPIPEYNKKTVFIAVGAAITSYARNYTIKAAQMNYYGPTKPGFIYADTDSLHMNLDPEDVKGVYFDSKEFGAWDLESKWQEGLFVRQKTYIEKSDNYYNIKCAGMTERCKEFLRASITQDYSRLEMDKLKEEEKDFIHIKRSIKDFKRGLCVPGKLLPKRIPGGVVLLDTTFEMR